MGTSRGAGRQPPRSMISAAPRRGERAPRGRGRGGSPSAGAPGGPRPEPGEGRRTGRSTPAPGAAATCVPRAVATSRTRSHACPAHSRSARWSCAVRNSASAGCVSQGRAGSTAGRRAPRSPASATGPGRTAAPPQPGRGRDPATTDTGRPPSSDSRPPSSCPSGSGTRPPTSCAATGRSPTDPAGAAGPFRPLPAPRPSEVRRWTPSPRITDGPFLVPSWGP